ncbi:ATP-dependent nuclease, partial [Frankia sp. Cas3]|uniref:ATP-dependent nuclease n=1 Tax=Frankia sp. Cas3 TaxID=3073926 RepID=UPI002AD2E529
MHLKSVSIKNYRSIESANLEFGPLTLFVGKNNSGKSAVLNVIHAMQVTGGISPSDIRYGASEMQISYQFERIVPRNWGLSAAQAETGVVTVAVNRESGKQPPHLQLSNGASFNARDISAMEPQNFIYPFLAKRKVTAFEEGITSQQTYEIRPNLSNLAARVELLMDVNHPAHRDFRSLVDEIINLPLSAVPSANGKQVGMWVNRHESIPLIAMGEGIPNMLGLITQLCLAKGHLFLIEELENDIHPEALKALLGVIERRVNQNQFIISTHSHIVVRYLGGIPATRIYEASLTDRIGDDYRLPTSTFTLVESTVTARSAVLKRLGFELSDFDLWEGWLILEESSAERLIKNYLIPWFVPRLSMIRTLSAGGTSEVEPTFNNYRRLFLFAHLEERYREAAWVIVDGDESGRKVIDKLQTTFGATWPKDHFRVWTHTDFERFYPQQFTDEVERVLAMPHGQHKQEAKIALGEQVRHWCDESPAEAEAAFKESAIEVITL